MRILFVVHGFPPTQVGGTEVLARNVARYMAKNRNDVFVFALAFSHEQEGDILFDGVRIHHVFLPPDRGTRFSESYFDATVDFQFAKFVLEVKPDVAIVWHTMGLSAGILEILSQVTVPYAVYLTDFHYLCHMTHLLTADMKPCDGPADGTKCANCILATIPRRLLEGETCDAAELGRRRVSRMRELLQAANVIVAPSSFVKEKYVEFGLKKERVMVIPPGVDVRAIEGRPKTVRSDKLRFGYLGGNSEPRGVSLVLDAFNFIADSSVELVIAGHGMERLLYTPVPRNTTIVGRYLPDRVGEVLSKIDVLVVPSRCHESYNLVIREAFAAKIPVIVSDLRAQSDAIREDIDGLHFKAGDASDLASKMRLLKDRRTILVKLRRGIRNVPEVDRQAAKFEKLLRELVRRRKAHARESFGTMLERIDHMQVQLVRLRGLEIIESLNERLRFSNDERTRLKNELSSKTEQVSSLQNELTKSIDRMEEEKASLTNEVQDLQKRLNTAISERIILRSQLEETHAEIEGIRRSFGFKVMRFYGSRIDRYFPNNTRHGKLKATIVQSFRIAGDQGIRSFLKEEHAVAVSKEKVKPSLAAIPRTRVLAHCDFPELSPNPVAVSDMIMISGWAVSDAGIKRVNVYLDNVPLGAVIYGMNRPDVGAAYPDFRDSQLSGFRKMISIEGDARKRPHVLKIVAESNDHSMATLEGMVEFRESPRIIVGLLDEEAKAQGLLIGPRCSIVILTKSPPADFDQTIERLTKQRLSSPPEIIIVNSGNGDMSNYAQKYAAKVINIPPEEFEHGSTRNYGAEKASGDYVFFMVDDAIPASMDLLNYMIRVLESDHKVVAATARQIPRTDADLMACQAIWGYYKMLGLDSDRVVSSANLDGLTSTEKRGVCQIDDVCSCYKREIFLEYKFNRSHAYAEDLELGIKLIKEGFKVAQIYSTGVIHSHNRSPTYYLKRTYVDTKTLSELLDYPPQEFREIDRSNIRSLDNLLDHVLDLNDRVSLAIDWLREHDFCSGDISQAFRTLEREVRSRPGSRDTPLTSNSDLSKCLIEIQGVIGHKRSDKSLSNPLSERFLQSLHMPFEYWLTSTHQSLADLEDDFVETLYKLLGVEIGRYLGRYRFLVRDIKPEDQRLARLDEFLSRGV